MDLFDFANDNNINAPLAQRMRPNTIENFIGQEHILSKNSLLMRAIKTDKLGSCIFYGPPGTGKTTLATIIANTTKSHFEKLNAVLNGVSDAKAIIDKARDRLKLYNKRTYLLLDECHRWNKAQSDCVLSAIEEGVIIFVGSTTENPYRAMTPAIVSRCRIFELKSLTIEDIVEGLKRAVSDKEKGLGQFSIKISDEAINHFALFCGGDMRNALNALELAVLSTSPDAEGCINVDIDVATQSIQKKSISVNESLYYDMISAFCKSLRGSDANAALYWAFRLVEGGCDPLLIFRRLIAHSCEDVGMANPNALNVVTNAYVAFEKIGLPEGRLPMAQAIIYVCSSPKSNSVYSAISSAIDAVNTSQDSVVPFYLRDRTYKSTLDDNSMYLYPHDYGGYVQQQYLPDCLKDEQFYLPSDNGYEKDIKQFLEHIDKKKKETNIK